MALSRQALWQQRQKAAGKCIACVKDAVKGSTRCRDHLLSHRAEARAAAGCRAWRPGGCGKRPILDF